VTARVLVRWSRPVAPVSSQRLLTATELTRLAAFRRDSDRTLFRSAHVLARLVVAELTGSAASGVVLTQRCTTCGGPHGRPYVEPAALSDPAAPPHVSWSHTADLVVAAATCVGPVGVDAESVSAIARAGVDRIALAEAERAQLESAEDPDRWRAIWWARKESLLKATGDGLTLPMSRVVVSPPNQAARLQSWPRAEPPYSRMADLDLTPDHAACLTILTPADRTPADLVPDVRQLDLTSTYLADTPLI